jgi:hypothetical protein
MKNLFKLTFTFLLLTSSLVVNAQNFNFKNFIWAFPNCNMPQMIKTWWDSGNGRLKVYTITKTQELSSDVLKMETNTKYGAGSFSFSYQDQNEVYIFYTDNTARVFERTTRGKTGIFDGINRETGSPTQELTACQPSSYAAKEMMSVINKSSNNAVAPTQSSKPNTGDDIYSPPKVSLIDLMVDTSRYINRSIEILCELNSPGSTIYCDSDNKSIVVDNQTMKREHYRTALKKCSGQDCRVCVKGILKKQNQRLVIENAFITPAMYWCERDKIFD